MHTAYCVLRTSLLSTVSFCSILFYAFLQICAFSMSRLHSSGLRLFAPKDTNSISLRPFKSPRVLAHRLFPKVKFFRFCREAHAAAQRALQKWRSKRQQRRLQRLAQGCWLRVATDCGEQGENIVGKWKNGCEEDEKCMHLILMQNASCKFWLTGQKVGDVSLVRSTYFHFEWHEIADWPCQQQFNLSTLILWTACTRTGQGSCQLHEENALPKYQPNSKVFQHLSPCYFTNVPHAWFHASGRHRTDIASFSLPQDAARRWLRVLHVKTARRRRQSEASHVKFEALLQETKTKSFEATKKRRNGTILKKEAKGGGKGKKRRIDAILTFQTERALYIFQDMWHHVTQYTESCDIIMIGKKQIRKFGKAWQLLTRQQHNWRPYNDWRVPISQLCEVDSGNRNEVQMRQGLAAAGSHVRSPGHKFSDLL